MELEEFRDKQFSGVAALALAAEAAMPGIDVRQEKATVTSLPDERTIRYYISEGLIPPAGEKRGTSSLFGYIHLLALLTIKKLQAENLPIKKIREIIEGKSEQELEMILGRDERMKNSAQEYLESLLLAPPPVSMAMEPPPAPMSAAPRSRKMQKPLFSAASEQQDSFGAAAEDSAPSEPQSWSRVDVTPGIELHMSSKIQAPADEKEIEGILGQVEKVLRSFFKKDGNK